MDQADKGVATGQANGRSRNGAAGDTALPDMIVAHGAATSSTASGWLWPAFKRLRYLPAIWLLLATGGLLGMYFQPPGLQWVMRRLHIEPGGGTTTPIAVPADVKPKVDPPTAGAVVRQVAALGKLVPEGDVRTVALPFGAGDARIAILNVEEGDRVEANQLIAVMDNEPQLMAAVDSARATVGAREAALEQTRQATQSSADEAQASLSRAKATLENAQRELDRTMVLARKGFSTTANVQARQTARDEAARDVEKATATLARYTSATIDSQPDVIVAIRNLDAAKAQLKGAERDLDKAYVRAPIAGTVLTVHARPGERPSSGIVNIGNIDRMTVEAEVYQSQIGFVAIGDQVEVTADSLPGILHGVVTRIGLEVIRQTVIDPSPAANTEARVIKVYIQLTPESSKLAQRYTNIQVLARIAAKGLP